MRFSGLFVAALVVILGEVSAFAQSQAPGRLYRGLFGGGMTGLRQSLTVRGTAGVGYSWRMRFGNAPVSGQPVPPAKVNSVFESFNGGINYGLQLSRLSINATGGAATTIYPKLEQPAIPIYRGGLGFIMPLWAGASIRAHGDVIRRPFYELPGLETGGLLEEQVGPVFDPILGLSGIFTNHTRTAAQGNFTQKVTTRLGLSAEYHYFRTYSEDQVLDSKSESAGAHLHFSLAKGLSLRAGYVESRHYFGPSGTTPYRVHNFDGGIDFNRSFSFTRGVTVTGGFGTSAITRGNNLRYYINGQASLTRDLGRSWNTGLRYERSLSLDEAFGQPFGSDRVILHLGGLINRRVRIQSGIGGRRSVSIFGGNGGYEQYFGRVGLMYAISRYAAFGSDYSYFAYRYDPNLALPFATNRRGDRHAIRMSVNVWAPILAQGRRNATR
jgi:hypothetical protein